MKTWQRMKAWAIRKLGGHLENQGPREKYFRHEQLTFLPLDRPFDPIDWERLVTMGQRERVYFEWLAHRIRRLDAEASKFKPGPEGDRDRLVYLARKDEIMRSFEVGREASEKLIKLLQQKERTDRQQGAKKGMTNNGG